MNQNIFPSDEDIEAQIGTFNQPQITKVQLAVYIAEWMRSEIQRRLSQDESCQHAFTTHDDYTMMIKCSECGKYLPNTLKP